MKLPAFESLYEKRDELADLEANYFSNIQFPTSWIDTSVNGLKQDVNAARRKRCNANPLGLTGQMKKLSI